MRRSLDRLLATSRCAIPVLAADDPPHRPSPEPDPPLPAAGDRHEGGAADQLEHHGQDDEQARHTDHEPRYGEGTEADRAERGERGVLEIRRRQRDIATVTGPADRQRGAGSGPDRAVARVT